MSKLPKGIRHDVESVAGDPRTEVRTESRMVPDGTPRSRRPCRFCGASLQHTFVDLGMTPLANTYLKPTQLSEMEPFYPLHVRVCVSCHLVQLEEFVRPENIFHDYAYFSSYSDTGLKYAKA